MTDLRGNIGWIIGSVVAMVAAFLGWAYESGLISALVGIMIGTGMAYFVQTRTQKSMEKRIFCQDCRDSLRSFVQGAKKHHRVAGKKMPF
jgi:uncharacterized membrane protein